jgi:hypothetical protein
MSQPIKAGLVTDVRHGLGMADNMTDSGNRFPVDTLKWIHLFNLLQKKDMRLEGNAVEIVFLEDDNLIMFDVVVQDAFDCAHIETRSKRSRPYSDNIPILPAHEQLIQDVLRFRNNSLHRLSFQQHGKILYQRGVLLPKCRLIFKFTFEGIIFFFGIDKTAWWTAFGAGDFFYDLF